MNYKLKILKALIVFLGAVFPAIFIYILSYFTTENAMVGSSENFADSVFTLLSILSYTGPFALLIGIFVIYASGQISGNIFDEIYKRYSVPLSEEEDQDDLDTQKN